MKKFNVKTISNKKSISISARTKNQLIYLIAIRGGGISIACSDHGV
jgi:hypothetical protein